MKFGAFYRRKYCFSFFFFFLSGKKVSRVSTGTRGYNNMILARLRNIMSSADQLRRVSTRSRRWRRYYPGFFFFLGFFGGFFFFFLDLITWVKTFPARRPIACRRHFYARARRVPSFAFFTCPRRILQAYGMPRARCRQGTLVSCIYVCVRIYKSVIDTRTKRIDIIYSTLGKCVRAT